MKTHVFFGVYSGSESHLCGSGTAAPRAVERGIFINNYVRFFLSVTLVMWCTRYFAAVSGKECALSSVVPYLRNKTF